MSKGKKLSQQKIKRTTATEFLHDLIDAWRIGGTLEYCDIKGVKGAKNFYLRPTPHIKALANNADENLKFLDTASNLEIEEWETAGLLLERIQKIFNRLVPEQAKEGINKFNELTKIEEVQK